MKNRKIFIVTILTLCTSFVMSSCNLIFDRLSSDNVAVDKEANENNITKYSDFGSGDKVDNSSVAKSSYSTIGNVTSTQGISSLPSIGTTRILVVPVELTGYNESDSSFAGFKSTAFTVKNSNHRYSANWYDLISNGFKGDSTNTGYESLASYYNKSSYGKLTIQPIITQVFSTTKTYTELNEIVEKDGVKYASDEVLSEIIEYFFEGSDPIYNYSDFDTNGDNVIDGIWMVYDVPYSSTNDMLWAYTTWYGDGTKSASEQNVSVYCWASKWFFTDGIYAEEPYVKSSSGNTSQVLADAHTFIHETGHMLGLDDYYDVSSESNRSPAGALLMMDHNVYDHDPYSKYLLGWVDPKRVKYSDFTSTATSFSYELKPFESSGDVLIVDLPNNTGWIGEEYLIVSYWTPTGLNEKDATNRYNDSSYVNPNENSYAGLTEKGIQIYHVDSRFSKYSFIGNYIGVATESEIENASYDQKYYYAMTFSNESTADGIKAGADDALIEFIDATNKYLHMSTSASSNGIYSTSSTNVAMKNSGLFHEGDKYNSSYLGKKTFTTSGLIHSTSSYVNIGFHGNSILTSTSYIESGLTPKIELTFGAQSDEKAAISATLES